MEPTFSDTGPIAVSTKGDVAELRKSPQLVPSGCFSTKTSHLFSYTASSRQLEETSPNHSVSLSENRATNASQDTAIEGRFSEDLSKHNSSDQRTVSITSMWTSTTTRNISLTAATGAISAPGTSAFTGVAANLPATTNTPPTTEGPVITPAADSNTDTENSHAVQGGASWRVEDQRGGVDEPGTITPPPALRTRSRMSSAASFSNSDLHAAGGAGGCCGWGVASGTTGPLATPTGRKGRVRARVIADTNSCASLLTANEERNARTPKTRSSQCSRRAAALSSSTEVRGSRTPRTPAVPRSACGVRREISAVTTPVEVRRTRAGRGCSFAVGSEGAAMSARTAENQRQAGSGRKRSAGSGEGIVTAGGNAIGVTPESGRGGWGGDGASRRVKRRARTEVREVVVSSFELFMRAAFYISFDACVNVRFSTS